MEISEGIQRISRRFFSISDRLFQIKSEVEKLETPEVKRSLDTGGRRSLLFFKAGIRAKILIRRSVSRVIPSAIRG